MPDSINPQVRHAWLSAVAVAAAFGATTVHAATVTLNATNVGFYHQNGTFASSSNHATGLYPAPATPPGEIRSFFVFDRSGVSGTIVGATLRLGNSASGYLSNDLTETLALFDVSTALAALTGLTGGTAAYADLGTGTTIGSVVVGPSSVNSIVEITLNASGLAYLNGAAGAFGIGGALTSIDPAGSTQALFNSTASTSFVRQLVLLLRDDPAPVPEPGSLALLGLGLAGMLLSLRRRCASR